MPSNEPTLGLPCVGSLVALALASIVRVVIQDSLNAPTLVSTTLVASFELQSIEGDSHDRPQSVVDYALRSPFVGSSIV